MQPPSKPCSAHGVKRQPKSEEDHGANDGIFEEFPEEKACPGGRGFVWAALEEHGEERERGDDEEEYTRSASDDAGDDGIQGPKENDQSADEEDQCDLEESGDARYGGGHIPLVPRFEAFLTDQDVFAGGRECRVPPQVLAKPLLDENTKKSRRETEEKAEEPQNVHPKGCLVGFKFGWWRKCGCGRVEEAVMEREALQLVGNPSEELHRVLGIISLQQLV